MRGRDAHSTAINISGNAVSNLQSWKFVAFQISRVPLTNELLCKAE